MTGMQTVGIIPARSGSKSVPHKNLARFHGKPLIAWTILTALQSARLDRVIVSTDSPTIARIARRFGAETPFLRPKSLATARIGIEPVLTHAYEWLKEQEGYQADALALLLPTNPLRRPSHIDEAIDLFVARRADSVVAVNETPANHTPYWTLVRHKRRRVTLFSGEPLTAILTRRQDFPQTCYARNDLVYVVRPHNLFEQPANLYGQRIELYVTGSEYDADINTAADWEAAELRFARASRND